MLNQNLTVDIEAESIFEEE